MALIIDEKKMVQDNIFQYEEKLKSPMSRFLDTTPTFVTYYHINPDETTVDEGFKDISSIIGFRSPIKYKKIQNFPLYGIEQVIPQIQEMDQGLDTDFNSEAIVLPGTIKPLENDFFMIPYLHDVYLFRVTEITYDNVMPDNFYKLDYKLEYIDQEKVDALEKQANETYTCILDNIGTENKCIIETDTIEKIEKIEKMYDDIATTYLSLFYDDRHNCLLGDLGKGQRLYDPFQTEFVNKHNLFNKKNNLKTLLFTNQVDDNKKRIKYEKSVYRFMERRDYTKISNFKYVYFQGSTYHETSFYRWADTTVQILDLYPDDENISAEIFSDEFVTSVKTNGFTKSRYAELMQRFLRDNDMSINDIPTDLNEELLLYDNNLEIFFIVPLIMYIIQTVVNKEIQSKM
jgi:hypothetical protein